MPESAPDELAIFTESLEKTGTQRDEFLAAACGSDHALRRRIEGYLRAHQEKHGPLDEPLAHVAAPTLDQPITERPGTQIGPYKLLEQIGEGGMGVVCMAEQKEPVRRRVALKIIKPGMDTRQVIARFEAERQALAMMDHPNIAKVLDAGATESGRPYFVMELVNGLPVTNYCDEQQLTPKERLELFVPICQAVQHAHQKGIIHRDLKPSNILVAMYDNKAVPKIIDFGVVKATTQTLTEKTMFTQLGQVVGTLEYMSPEQAQRNQLDVDTRSDVYSLGVLLYELLTGETPFDRERLRSAAFDEILRIIREEEPSRPSTKVNSSQSLPSIAANRRMEPAKLGSMIRGELDWIVMKALEKDRQRRYKTAEGFAADIERYLRDEPVLACPPSAAYRVRKFVKRHKGPVVAVCVLLLALVGGTLGTTMGLVRAERARQAEAARAAAEHEAKEAERKAKETAEAREAETRAVLDFVENRIFAAARPEGVDGGLGCEVTLRKALEAALPLVEKTFTDQPLMEARLRYTLAKSFTYLGEAHRALEQLLAAQTLYSQHGTPDHADTLACMDLLGSTYLSLDRPADAAKLHEKTWAIRKALLGPENVDTLMSMHLLAKDYHALHRDTEGLKLRQETLAIRKATLGPNHRDTLRSMHDLANSYESLGRLTDALRLHEETLALQKINFGPDDSDTLFSMHEVACCYSALGRLDDARRLQEQRLAIMKAKFGPDHPDTIAGMYHLALVLFAQGQHDDALQLHEQALALAEAKLGFDHGSTLRCMNTLAANYLIVGRDADALKLLDECWKRVKGKVADPGVVAQLMTLRLVYFAKTEDVAGCRATAETWEQLRRTDADSLYEAARMHAVVATVISDSDKTDSAAQKSAAEADQAMAWLRQAVAAGYTNGERVKNDTFLDILRDREDFKKLLSEFESEKENRKK